MPATIQGYRPDPRIRQTQLAELRRLYGEVIRRQQGAIGFLARKEGSGPRATLEVLGEALRQDRGHPTVVAGGAYAPVAMAQTDYDQALDVLGNLLAVAEQVRVQDVSVNGMITNDKFCLTRRGALALSWWRRPLRLRNAAY